MSPITYLLNKYPDPFRYLYPFNKDEYAKDPNYKPISDSAKYKLKWDRQKLSRNPAISFEFIKNTPLIKWEAFYISRNPNLTPEEIDAYINNGKRKKGRGHGTKRNKWWALWDWDNMTDHPNITIELIKKYPNERWSFEHIKIKDLLETEDDYSFITKEGWYYISSSEEITMDFVEKHAHLPWDKEGLSANPNMTYKFYKEHIGFNIEKHAHIPWKKESLPVNINIPNIFYKKEYIGLNINSIAISTTDFKVIDKILSTHKFKCKMELYEFMSYLSGNENMNETILEKYSEYTYRLMQSATCYSNISIEFIIKHIDWEWEFYKIPLNPNFSMRYLNYFLSISHKYSDMHVKYFWVNVGKHPKLTEKIFIKYSKYLNKQLITMDIDVSSVPDDEKILANENISIEFWINYPEKFYSIDINQLFKRTDLDFNVIEAYLQNPFLITNKSIRKFFITKRETIFCHLSSNPNITVKFIETYLKEIHFGELSRNKFTYANKIWNNKKLGYWALENISNPLPKAVNKHVIITYI